MSARLLCVFGLVLSGASWRLDKIGDLSDRGVRNTQTLLDQKIDQDKITSGRKQKSSHETSAWCTCDLDPDQAKKAKHTLRGKSAFWFWPGSKSRGPKWLDAVRAISNAIKRNASVLEALPDDERTLLRGVKDCACPQGKSLVCLDPKKGCKDGSVAKCLIQLGHRKPHTFAEAEHFCLKGFTSSTIKKWGKVEYNVWEESNKIPIQATQEDYEATSPADNSTSPATHKAKKWWTESHSLAKPRLPTHKLHNSSQSSPQETHSSNTSLGTFTWFLIILIAGLSLAAVGSLYHSLIRWATPTESAEDLAAGERLANAVASNLS